jgi:hypothetical protein
MSQKLISTMLSGKVVYSDRACGRFADVKRHRTQKRIIRQQEQARDAEQRLVEVLE